MRTAWASLFLILFASFAVRAGSSGEDVLLPPDLEHVHHVGCHIDAHRSDPPIFTLNAKTGEQEEQVLWWVTPFADYEPLPDGTKREPWEPMEKDGVTRKPLLGKYPGTDDDMAGARVACGAWMKKERAAQIALLHKRGH